MDITTLSGNAFNTITTNNSSTVDTSSINNGIIQSEELTDTNDVNKNYSSSAFYLADSIKRQASEISTVFSNANGAVAFTQVTNVALSKQNEILDDIKDKLLYVKQDTTTNNEIEIIRQDVVSLLEKFDDIAADSNYNKQYYLQKSNSDNSESLIYQFQLGTIPSITLSTDSIQSNTEGLGLTTLKGLSTNELTDTVAVTQSGVVDDAITSIDTFQSKYQELQGQFKLAVSSLDILHKKLKDSETDLRTVDYAKESMEFNKSKILSQYGSLVSSQANSSSSAVSSLLSSSMGLKNTSFSATVTVDNTNIPSSDIPTTSTAE